MMRVLAERFAFFIVPFALYAAFLLVQLINPFAIDRWTRRVVTGLTLAGLVLAVGSIVAYGVFATRYEGTYQPAHIENGQLVPGRMR